MAYATKSFNRSLLNPAAKAFQPRMGAGRGYGAVSPAGAAIQAVEETEGADGAAAGIEYGEETVYGNEGAMCQDPGPVIYADNGVVVGSVNCCENLQQVQPTQQSQQLLWVPITLSNGQVLYVYPLQGYANGSATNAAGVAGYYQQQQEVSHLSPAELPQQLPQEMPQQLINSPIATSYQPLSIVYQQMQPQQTANVPQLTQALPYQQVTNVYAQQQSPPQQQQLQYLPQQAAQPPVQYVQHQQQLEQQQQQQATLQYLPQQQSSQLPPQYVQQATSNLPQQQMPVVYQQLPIQQTSNMGYQQLPNNHQVLPQHYGNDVQVVQQAAPVDGVASIKTYMCNNRGFNRVKQIVNKPKRRTQQQLDQAQAQQQQPPQQGQSRYKCQGQPQVGEPLTSSQRSQWHQIVMSAMFNVMLDEGEPISYAFIVSQLALRLYCPEELMKRLVPNVLYDASNKGFVRRSNGNFMLGVNLLNGMHKID